MNTMKPITDCEYAQEDGYCGHPNAATPECHTGACPRLAAFLPEAITVCVAWETLAQEDMPFRHTLAGTPFEIGLTILRQTVNVLDAAQDRAE